MVNNLSFCVLKARSRAEIGNELQTKNVILLIYSICPPTKRMQVYF
jgi:hypothetical protein